jgi:hypothetical protein
MTMLRTKSLIAIKYVWLGTVTIFLPLSLLLPSASVSQVVYGNGPSSPYNTPAFAPKSESYTLQTEVGCPTASFNVSAFAGRANDWANNLTPYASSNSGVGNYGVALGFSTPLGADDLREFCSNYAASKADAERQRVETQRLIGQLALLQQCQWFIDQGYDLENPVFKSDGVLSSIGQCNPLKFVLNDPERAKRARISGPDANSTTTPTTPKIPQPSLPSQVPPFSPSALPVTQIR